MYRHASHARIFPIEHGILLVEYGLRIDFTHAYEDKTRALCRDVQSVDRSASNERRNENTLKNARSVSSHSIKDLTDGLRAMHDARPLARERDDVTDTRGRNVRANVGERADLRRTSLA